MSVADSSDAWGDSTLSSANTQPVSARQRDPEPVRDDWDDDDSDEDDDPQKVWEDANTKAPMPQLVIAPSATATSVVQPPAAAFQPSVRILKRPSAASSTPSSSSTAEQQKSIAEREADYQAARERIFGNAAAATSATSRSPDNAAATRIASRKGSPNSVPARNATPPIAKISRSPRGPPRTGESTDPAIAKGFQNRSPPNPPRSPATQDTRQ